MTKKQYWDLAFEELDYHFEHFIEKSADGMILELNKKRANKKIIVKELAYV